MKEILEKAIEHYGEAHQKLKAVEELSELIQAILKEMDCTDLADWQDRQNNVDEEMADVEIKRVLFRSELSELIQAILKEMDCTDLCDWQDRQNNVDEEMADVEIMLAQLRMIYQNDKRVEKWKERKVGMLDLSIPEEEE